MTNVPISRVTPVSRRMLIGGEPMLSRGGGPACRGGPFRAVRPRSVRGAGRGASASARVRPSSPPRPARSSAVRAARRRQSACAGSVLAPARSSAGSRWHHEQKCVDRAPITIRLIGRPQRGTRLARPLVDLQPLLHRAVAVGRGVVVDGAAAPLDGLGQDRADRVVQVALVGRPERRGRAQRVKPRRPQRLVRVDVADAGQERLVEQERLEPALAPADEPRRKSRTVNSGSSGSGPRSANTAAPPTSVTSSPVTGSRPYSPTLPNLRMSRNRSSRPSASSSTSRTYGSTGVSAGTTNSWPVILRWIVRAAPPESSTTTSFARRPTASTRRPAIASAKSSGVWVRSVRAQRCIGHRRSSRRRCGDAGRARRSRPREVQASGEPSRRRARWAPRDPGLRRLRRRSRRPG